MLLMLVGLVLALVSAGCISGTGDEEVDPNTQQEPEVDPPPPEPNATLGWRTEAHDGSITSARAVILATNTQGSDTVLELQVPDDATTWGFLATANGGPLDILVGHPGCQPNSGCEETVNVEDGAEANWTAQQAEPGTWTLRFFHGGVAGAGQIDWTVEAGWEVPMAADGAS
ncbi:MAG: hypothetical protein R3185_08825 [Candidatus Thermoplasmatota archaeon]|nr:hypothetical protein [Candidatus Thermoplasmatota archaeon]